MGHGDDLVSVMDCLGLGHHVHGDGRAREQRCDPPVGNTLPRASVDRVCSTAMGIVPEEAMTGRRSLQFRAPAPGTGDSLVRAGRLGQGQKLT